MSNEYSDKFDEIRKGLVEQSFYKYGPVAANYSNGNIDAMASLQNCIRKYEETGNKEYLCDLANYAMFEYMYPQHPKAHFRHTSSVESAGIVGMGVAEIKKFSNEDSTSLY